MNLVDAILFQCRRQPPVAAICVPGQERGLISYRRLEQGIHNISRRLQSFGLAPGSIVAVNIQDVILHTATLLALMRLGLATLTIPDGLPALPFDIDALISDAEIPGSTGGRVVRVDYSWMQGDGQPIDPRYVPSTDEKTICRLMLTSGSTGIPKAVAVSQRLLSDRINRHLTVFGNKFPGCDRLYSDMLISTSLGFQFLIYSLLRGGTIIFPGDRFDSTLQAIEEYKVQCLIAPPGGLETFVRWFDTIPAYQSSIELIFCGGDILSSSLSNHVRSRICSHIVVAYGSTEASMTAAALAHEIMGTAGAVGFVTPGTTVQIVDRSGTVLRPGREGLLRIRSDYAVDGYLNSPEETTQAFRDGWFYPGDIGALDEDELLVITGREQITLNIGGDKINPEAIERVLAAFDGVREAGVFSLPNEFGNNEICAAVVCEGKPDEQKLKAHCAAHLALNSVPSRIFFASRLPRNDMGKIDRLHLPSIAGQTSGG
jgi:acyl-coenzyme A synthetase/AMP-(fatty) acid ligase